jgi:hypothetical protein
LYFNGQVVIGCATSPCYLAPATLFPVSTGFQLGLNALTLVVDNAQGHPNATGASVIARLSGTCGAICLLPETGQLKICKVAGAGIVPGTMFGFTASTANSQATTLVPAGAGPGGTCALGPGFPVGTVVNVGENIPAGDAVTAIVVAPPGRVATAPNYGQGTVGITIGSGVTEVTYTDERHTGYLEVCKNSDTKRDFNFTVEPGHIALTVPAGACSPAIEVPAGQVVIRETQPTGMVMSGCKTFPAAQQVSCSPGNLTSTVNVAPGDISTQTVAIINNVTPGKD